MVYTEIKERNRNKYYYRVKSIRNKDKISKKRIYLGVNLNLNEKYKKEDKADKFLLNNKVNKVIESIKSKILPILNKNNIKKAGIFGSYARGDQKDNSDVDIIVKYPKGMGLGFVSFAFELENALEKKNRFGYIWRT